MLAAKLFAKNVVKEVDTDSSILIEPAYQGRTQWDLVRNGPLIITSSGSWTITPLNDLLVDSKLWGAGGGGGGPDGGTNYAGPGGGAGFAGGIVKLQKDISYIVNVGGGGKAGFKATAAGKGLGGYNGGGDGADAGPSGASGGGGGGGGRTEIKYNEYLYVCAAGGGGGGGDGYIASNGPTPGNSITVKNGTNQNGASATMSPMDGGGHGGGGAGFPGGGVQVGYTVSDGNGVGGAAGDNYIYPQVINRVDLDAGISRNAANNTDQTYYGEVGNGGNPMANGNDGLFYIARITQEPQVVDYPVTITASGGSVTTSGNYVIHTFTSSGTFEVTQANSNTKINIFIVAGGGSGGYDAGGGGGGGGVARVLQYPIGVGSYSVVVGAGGASLSGQGINGTNSSFDDIVALGGGGGGRKGTNGNTGGSGGGGGHLNRLGASGVPYMGYNGGNGTGNRGGGGGGSSGSGNLSGVGGLGTLANIPGINSSVLYGCGGGGGVHNEETITGTCVGGPNGGSGGTKSLPPTAGVANTGQGGGGGGNADLVSRAKGAAGGSGIVFVTYRKS